jgi:hypothetical protein
LTETVTDCFGVSVTFDPPLSVNPPPVAVTLEITRFAVPVSVNVTSCEVGVPIATFPKATLIELAEIAGAGGGFDPPPPLDPPAFVALVTPHAAPPNSAAKAIIAARRCEPGENVLPLIFECLFECDFLKMDKPSFEEGLSA